MAKNYLSVVYDEESHPYNDYPKKLCSYLFQAFALKKGMKMLEPGCGRGEFLNNFKDLGLDVIGVDISAEAIALKAYECLYNEPPYLNTQPNEADHSPKEYKKYTENFKGANGLKSTINKAHNRIQEGVTVMTGDIQANNYSIPKSGCLWPPQTYPEM